MFNLTTESRNPTEMSSSTMNNTIDCASNTPSSSSNRPAAINKPKNEKHFSKLPRGGERSWTWQLHDGDRATSSHPACLNSQGTAQSLETEPLAPRELKAAMPCSLASSPLVRKAPWSPPGKVTGKRSASTAEIGETSVLQKRVRREDPTEAPHTLESPPASQPQLENRPDTLAIITKTMGTTNPSSYAAEDAVNVPSHDNINLGNRPVAEVGGTPDSRKDMSMKGFIDMLYAGLMRSEEGSPHISGGSKQTHLSDLFKEGDRKHAAQAAATYKWSDLYNDKSQSRKGLGGKGAGTQGVPTPAGAVGDEAQHGRVAPEPLSNAPQDSSAPVVPIDVPAADATPIIPFRYTPEREAEIRDAVLQANYTSAYRLFEPSERPKVIDGEEVKRFVSDHPDKVTKTGRKATRLWVCQATAMWATDGTVSYTPEPCKAACTSRDICMRHISTRHLAKARGQTGLQ